MRNVEPPLKEVQQHNSGHRRLLSPTFETPFDNLFKKCKQVAQPPTKQRRSASVQRPPMADPVRRSAVARPVRLVPSTALTIETADITTGKSVRSHPSKRGPLKPANSENAPPVAKADALAQTQVTRPRVSFDLWNCSESDKTEWQEEIPSDETERPFREPTDFSKVCHFPSQWLSSKSQEASQSPRSGIVRLESKERLHNIAPLDEFLKMESEMEEVDHANDRSILNYHKMSRIVKESVKENQTDVLRIMTNHRNEHFVLLLARPRLHLLGVYLLKANLGRIEKLWGSGPAIIRPMDTDTCWYYNIISKGFVPCQRRAFQTNLDAVSL
jgi:hypothetical protein